MCAAGEEVLNSQRQRASCDKLRAHIPSLVMMKCKTAKVTANEKFNASHVTTKETVALSPDDCQ